jgi:hypothetical protein
MQVASIPVKNMISVARKSHMASLPLLIGRLVVDWFWLIDRP